MSPDREHNFLPLQSVVFALSKARNLLAAELDAALADDGIKSSQVGALLLLERGTASSPGALSRQLDVESGAVTRMLHRLERKSLVCRHRSSLDRRVVNLTLTETGQVAAGRIAQIVSTVLNRRLSGFTSLEFSNLSHLLSKLLDE
jgi:DNA-binding MarR family transcriptional regulator